MASKKKQQVVTEYEVTLEEVIELLGHEGGVKSVLSFTSKNADNKPSLIIRVFSPYVGEPDA